MDVDDGWRRRWFNSSCGGAQDDIQQHQQKNDISVYEIHQKETVDASEC